MDNEKLKIAVVEMNKALRYNLEMRIAKYLIQAGYSGRKNNMSNIIQEVDPTLSQVTHNKIWNYMRDIEHTHSPKNPYHIDNIPDLFPS
jgi:hypothetical protein